MKLLTKILLALVITGCSNEARQNGAKKTPISIQKNSEFKTFKSYINKNLKEIRHDSVWNANKKSSVNSYLLSIIPSREKGFWILLSVENKSVFSNFKNSKTEISGKSYDKVKELITELKQKQDIDDKFCFGCYADPTFFVLEEVVNGKTNRKMNVIEDWQSIFSQK
jgi:hypothetical protein